jgi:hypothetical protein
LAKKERAEKFIAEHGLPESIDKLKANKAKSLKPTQAKSRKPNA